MKRPIQKVCLDLSKQRTACIFRVRKFVNFVVKSTLRIVHNRVVSHITVVELQFNHGDVTNRPIMDYS
jgi:hypothetical protein